MDTETNAGGALSVDDAVSLMGGTFSEREDEQAAEAPAEAAVEADDEITSEVETTDPDDAGEADEPGDGEETEEPAEAAAELVEAPQWWSKEAKARFAQLPPELQAEVIAQEGKREEVTQKAKAEAKQAVEAAEQRVRQVEQLAQGLNEVLPRALQTFRDKWADVDWAAWAEQDPEAAFKGKLQFEQEQADLQILARKQAEAEQVRQAEYLKAEFARLQEVAPDLYGMDEPAVQRRQEVGKFLLEAGIPPEAVQGISATELAIARDAMLWRRAQAEARTAAAKPKQPQAPVKAPPAVKAAAAAPQRTSQQRRAEQLQGRLSRTGSIDDAVALLQALRK